MDHELLATKLRNLREAKNWSRRELSFATVRLGYEGVPESTIEALETKPGRIPEEAATIEALAAALEVDPAAFYEWPIVVARRDARVTSPAEDGAGPARGPVDPEAPGLRPKDERPSDQDLDEEGQAP